jgi:acetate kinase
MNAPLLLTFNPGSSSVKIGLYEVANERPTRVPLGTIDFRSKPLLLLASS